MYFGGCGDGFSDFDATGCRIDETSMQTRGTRIRIQKPVCPHFTRYTAHIGNDYAPVYTVGYMHRRDYTRSIINGIRKSTGRSHFAPS